MKDIVLRNVDFIKTDRNILDLKLYAATFGRKVFPADGHRNATKAIIAGGGTWAPNNSNSYLRIYIGEIYPDQSSRFYGSDVYVGNSSTYTWYDDHFIRHSHVLDIKIHDLTQIGVNSSLFGEWTDDCRMLGMTNGSNGDYFLLENGVDGTRWYGRPELDVYLNPIGVYPGSQANELGDYVGPVASTTYLRVSMYSARSKRMNFTEYSSATSWGTPYGQKAYAAAASSADTDTMISWAGIDDSNKVAFGVPLENFIGVSQIALSTFLSNNAAINYGSLSSYRNNAGASDGNYALFEGGWKGPTNGSFNDYKDQITKMTFSEKTTTAVDWGSMGRPRFGTTTFSTDTRYFSLGGNGNLNNGERLNFNIQNFLYQKAFSSNSNSVAISVNESNDISNFTDRYHGALKGFESNIFMKSVCDGTKGVIFGGESNTSNIRTIQIAAMEYNSSFGNLGHPATMQSAGSGG